jgi:hypothetical protein
VKVTERLAGAALMAAALLTSGLASAEDAKVQLNADVVLMSNQGNTVDPALASMKDTFSKEGLLFSSYKRLSSQRVVLTSKKPTEVSLPNQQKAVLKLEGVKHGAATVAVNIGAVNTTYTVGRAGSVFINFGHQDGELVLVLSPVAASHPRMGGVLRPLSRLLALSPRAR